MKIDHVRLAGLQTLAEEINAMAADDQAMRERALQQGELGNPGLDQRNTGRMMEIVERHGWPTKSLVGEEAAHNAWLLVQHADHAATFQSRCLSLMKGCAPGEVLPANIARLEDRVRINQGQFQLYGTQGRPSESGSWDLLSIDDPAQVDARRRLMGLGPLNEYVQYMQSRYATPSS